MCVLVDGFCLEQNHSFVALSRPIWPTACGALASARAYRRNGTNAGSGVKASTWGLFSFNGPKARNSRTAAPRQKSQM